MFLYKLAMSPYGTHLFKIFRLETTGPMTSRSNSSFLKRGTVLVCLRSVLQRPERPSPPYLFVFLLSIISSSKGCPPRGIRIPGILSYIRILKIDIGKRMLSSPPASILPRFGRNQFKAGRRTMTAIRVNACRARRPCQNQFIADSQQ